MSIGYLWATSVTAETPNHSRKDSKLSPDHFLWFDNKVMPFKRLYYLTNRDGNRRWIGGGKFRLLLFVQDSYFVKSSRSSVEDLSGILYLLVLHVVRALSSQLYNNRDLYCICFIIACFLLLLFLLRDTAMPVVLYKRGRGCQQLSSSTISSLYIEAT